MDVAAPSAERRARAERRLGDGDGDGRLLALAVLHAAHDLPAMHRERVQLL